jgi:AraC family transcriptional regulator
VSCTDATGWYECNIAAGVDDMTTVPVTAGCTRFRSVEVDGFHVAGVQFPPLLALPLHTHERPTVAVILRGSFEGLTRGGQHPCPAGSVLTEPAGEPHGNRFHGAGAKVLVMQPDPARGELLEPFTRLLAKIDYRRDALVVGLAHRAARELTASDAVAPLALEGLVLELLAATARATGTCDDYTEHSAPRWLEQARALLHDRYREQLRVSDVAAAVGVHPVHLTRTFQAHYGTGVGAYLRGLRLDQAARQLAGTDVSIADIAVHAGFYDQSHFTRSFKREYGSTPLTYRQATKT